MAEDFFNTIFLNLTTHNIMLPFLYMEKMKVAPKKTKAQGPIRNRSLGFFMGRGLPLPSCRLDNKIFISSRIYLSRSIFW